MSRVAESLLVPIMNLKKSCSMIARDRCDIGVPGKLNSDTVWQLLAVYARS
jgi:hypothetical protein